MKYDVTTRVDVIDEQALMKAACAVAEGEQIDPPETVEKALIWLIDHDMPPLDCGFEVVDSFAERCDDDPKHPQRKA